MRPEIAAMHLRAGYAYGQASACGAKIDFKSEDTATSAAAAVSTRREWPVEAYPCAWCQGWHIGRALTAEEITQFKVTGC
jgi:hypothetical protein